MSNSIQIPGFDITRQIGQGGMAKVYLGTKQGDDTPLALKLINPQFSEDPQFRQRFEKEVSILSQLKHPNIVRYYGAGQYRNQVFMALEFVPGDDLKKRIKSQQLSLKDILIWIKGIAMGLDFAHRKGYIHRDIKPENILLRADGTAVITDFGIAKARSSAAKLTGTGLSIGTPYYMSPEQARGKQLDQRTDIYSAGVLLFELLTGHVPFSSEDPISIGIMHLSKPVPKLPSQLVYWQPIINKMMAKDPGDRYNAMMAAYKDVEKLDHSKHLIFKGTAAELETIRTHQQQLQTKLTTRTHNAPPLTRPNPAKNTVAITPVPASQQIRTPQEHMQQPNSHATAPTQIPIAYKPRKKKKRFARTFGIMLLIALIAFLGYISYLYTILSPIGQGALFALRPNANLFQELTALRTLDARWASHPNDLTAADYALIKDAISNYPDDEVFWALLNSAITYDTLIEIKDFNQIHSIYAEQRTNPLAAAHLPTDEFLIAQKTSSLQNAQRALDAAQALNIPGTAVPLTSLEASLADARSQLNNTNQPNGIPNTPPLTSAPVQNNPPQTGNTNTNTAPAQSLVPPRAPTTAPAQLQPTQPQPTQAQPIETTPTQQPITPSQPSQATSNASADRQFAQQVANTLVSIPANPARGLGGFQISRYETSYAQYDYFAQRIGWTLPDSNGQRGNMPVSYVTYNEALEYSKFLSRISGRQYGLPTLAQWQEAVRADPSSNASYSWGESPDFAKDYAVCRDVRCNSSTLASVSALKGNLYGVHHGHGNVAEWTNTCSGGTCAVAGGSYKKSLPQLAIGAEERLQQSLRASDIGFRVVAY